MDPDSNLQPDLAGSLSAEEERSLDRAADEAVEGLTNADLISATAGPTPQDPVDGAILRGRIANIGSQDILIDFDGKSLGSMPLSEFGRDESYNIGDHIEVAIVGQDSGTGLAAVSRRKARQIKLLGELKVGSIVEGVVTGMNKGGLEVDVDGVRGFIPASQVDVQFMKDISALFGRTIKAVVAEFRADDDNLVLSRRKWLEQEAAEQKEEQFAALQVGQLKTGTVRSVVDYGAFVDIGGVDGLLHVTDMSWGRITKPEEVVKVGDKVEVKIIKLQRAQRKVSLSLRQATPNPWQAASDKYKPGETHQGRVLRMQNFGAFVELEPGVEALLPVSELSWTRRVRHPSELLKEGDVVEVRILGIEADKQRISLSLRQLTEDPWSVAAQKFSVGGTVKGKVVRTADFGAFVELEEGIDGLVHISELSDQRVKAVTDRVKVGQEVEARVLGIDPATKRISLSLRPPPRQPTPEELAAVERERQAAQKRRERSKSRRGGLTIAWDEGLAALDPSKFGR